MKKKPNKKIMQIATRIKRKRKFNWRFWKKIVYKPKEYYPDWFTNATENNKKEQ